MVLGPLRRGCTDGLIPTLLACLLVSSCSKAESVCATCMQEKCASLIESCRADQGCACMVDCVGEGGIPGVEVCLGTCGLSARPAPFGPVEECTAVACPDPEDECATPEDWKPPHEGEACDGLGQGAIGVGSLADCGFDPALPFDPAGTVLQLESANPRLCVWLERRDEGAGNLANTSWGLAGLRVGPPGQVVEVSASTDACWYSSHHNFRDWVHVWTGNRHFDLAIKVDLGGGPSAYQLFVYEAGPIEASACAPDADGERCIAGPIELQPVMP